MAVRPRVGRTKEVPWWLGPLVWTLGTRLLVFTSVQVSIKIKCLSRPIGDKESQWLVNSPAWCKQWMQLCYQILSITKNWGCNGPLKQRCIFPGKLCRAAYFAAKDTKYVTCFSRKMCSKRQIFHLHRILIPNGMGGRAVRNDSDVIITFICIPLHTIQVHFLHD